MNHSLRFALIISFLSVQSLTAQKTDSLQAVLDTAKNHYRVKTLNEMFRAYLPSDPVKAIGYSREALTYATEIGDKKGLAAAYNNLGVAYRGQGALDKALEYYIHSLRLYEELDNKEGIATTKNNISNIHGMKRDFSEALKFLQESHKIFAELNDESKMIGSLNNMGNLYSDIGLYDKALQSYTQSSQLSEKKGLKFSDPINNIGNIHFKQQNYQRAVEFYEKALVQEREADDKEGMLNTLTNLAITYAKARQPEPAQKYLDEALTLCNTTQAHSFLPSLYKAQAENLANQSKWKEAYDFQLKYDQEREKMFGEESTRKIAQMELLLSFEETEKKFELLKKDDAVKSLELHNTRLVIVLVILAVLIILGILNYYFLGRKKGSRKKAAQVV
jgi:tetratricopeptide (TPR) repeat protein